MNPALPRDVLLIIISFCPHSCWSLNKYCRSVAYEFLTLQEKHKALLHAATNGYLEMLSNILEVIIYKQKIITLSPEGFEC